MRLPRGNVWAVHPEGSGRAARKGGESRKIRRRPALSREGARFPFIERQVSADFEKSAGRSGIRLTVRLLRSANR